MLATPKAVLGRDALLVGTKSGSVYAFDVVNGKVLAALRPDPAPVRRLVAEPELGSVLAVKSDGAVYRIKLAQP